MISGEYDLIATAAPDVQKICDRSAPILNAVIAAKYGAPVYSKLPPTTPILPQDPFLNSCVRRGTKIRTCSTRLDALSLCACIALSRLVRIGVSDFQQLVDNNFAAKPRNQRIRESS